MGAEEEEEQKGVDLKQEPTRSITQPMTQAQFLSWKQHKDADASAKKAEAERKRAEDVVVGKVPMNGRELFLHEPWVFDNTRY
ncbi:zinc finger CCCH domain protein [Thalictrum thalictroides]|uniref:Zinc finger CCCH domain protein n=1 Tax=Thalictrum thalictroides TaxID=46969 RepID=A0A7J6V8M1_THATH|nr:zinc finger CCCH domain protein [Thalictrum thalictroides]